MAPFVLVTVAALVAAMAPAARAQGEGKLSFLVVGDWGRQGADQPQAARDNQTRVAAMMAAFAEGEEAAGAAWQPVSVGDNFYESKCLRASPLLALASVSILRVHTCRLRADSECVRMSTAAASNGLLCCLVIGRP